MIPERLFPPFLHNAYVYDRADLSSDIGGKKTTSPWRSPPLEETKPKNECFFFFSRERILTFCWGCRVQTAPPIPRTRRTKGNSVGSGRRAFRVHQGEGVQRVIGVGGKTTAAGAGRGGEGNSSGSVFRNSRNVSRLTYR